MKAGLAAAAILAVAMSAPATIAAAKGSDYVYGPPPEWNRYKEVAEAGVRARLPDSQNWAIEWPNGYLRTSWKHKGRFDGYVTCGIMRAIAPVTDRNPRTQFVVVVDHDAVKTVDIGQRGPRTIVNFLCDNAVATGGLPPARLMPTATNASTSTTAAGPVVAADVPATPSGLKLRIMPEGAYVGEVLAGSAAAKAGITPGLVITHANGIALAGMGLAMAQVVGSDVATMTIETAAGTRIDLRRAP
ncbi:PDZ domain-containing protein [Sphingomonas rubra]|uniref:PDZ domain-containing protein n=1 Tax=Sphingomonas rubra TaxID=634430 RepID=A0A1I5TNM6_9SPHN|nr:PDZ domain-containing protein [Sphingomonas rubra]SFP84207.1 hypothetical protein SAMN04488241_108148 [Sphingomonas rubra]